jgi:hypothetical protein
MIAAVCVGSAIFNGEACVTLGARASCPPPAPRRQAVDSNTCLPVVTGRPGTGETPALPGDYPSEILCCARAACTRLRPRTAVVTGPVPPGTGVIAPATADADSKWTSPTSRP